MNSMNLLAAISLIVMNLGQARGGEMTAALHQERLDGLMATMHQTIAQGPYTTNMESLGEHVAPDWYADAKLGIFIHYGLFSVPGYSGVGCWYGNNMYDPTKDAYAFHRENFGPQDQFGYKDFAPHLTASAFNADEWVSLFKQAGAKFVVPVSCFHDGFAMWDSKLTDWNAVKTGPKRDYDGLLAAAARRQGLKFGVAWHAFFRPYFFAPGRGPDTDIQPPNSGTPWSFYGPATETPEFVDDGLGRLVELVEGYHPDLVWFDFDTQYVQREDLRQFTTFYFNCAAQWKQDVVINDKHQDRFPPHSYVLDFERGQSAGLQSELWQTDTSVSWRDWSYMDNDSFKTADELIHQLVDVVSKNGVLLLDIGPRADGSIPPEPKALLHTIGSWLKINGDAIYGTRPCWALGFGEGPHNFGGGGFTDRAMQYSAHDFRFTQRGNIIYAIAMAWPPVEDHFLIHSFNSRTVVATGGIESVKLLGCDERLDWKLTEDGLWIRLPSRRPCYAAYAFTITLHGVSVEQLKAQRINDRQIQVELQIRNFDSRPHEQPLAFQDNQNAIGTENITLNAGETATNTSVFDAAAAGTMERITVRLPGGEPFAEETELLSPPDAGAGLTFDGKMMLAGRDLGTLSKLTLSLWIRTQELRGDRTALFNTADEAPDAKHIHYLGTGRLQASFQDQHSNVVMGVSEVMPGIAEGWQLVTVTFDADAKQAVLFINGKLDAETTPRKTSPVNFDAFTLGGSASEDNWFIGQMADVRLYDRVLNSQEIEALREGNPSSEGLVAAWDFKQSGGGIVRDTTGHGHNLTEVR